MLSAHAIQLMYTRGTAIPLYLVIECSDTQVLDLMSAPGVPTVRLMRTMSIGYDRGGGNSSFLPNGEVQPHLSQVAAIDAFKNLTERVQKAGWWQLPVHDKTSGQRRELQGEIHLPSNLQTTTHLGRFDYYVCLASIHPRSRLTFFDSTRSSYIRPRHLRSFLMNTVDCKQFPWSYVQCLRMVRRALSRIHLRYTTTSRGWKKTLRHASIRSILVSVKRTTYMHSLILHLLFNSLFLGSGGDIYTAVTRAKGQGWNALYIKDRILYI